MQHSIAVACLASLCAITTSQAASNASGNLKQADITLSNNSDHTITVVSHLAANHDSNDQPYAMHCLNPVSPQQFSWFSIPLSNHTTVLAQGLILNAHQSATLHYQTNNPSCQDNTSVADSLATYIDTPKTDSLIADDLNFQFYDKRAKLISFYADVFANPSNIRLNTERSIVYIDG